MEWDFEIKLQIWRFAFLRKKDKYMVGANAKRWAIGYLERGECWAIVFSV